MALPTLLSLFSGAGGMDHGFAAANFRLGAAVELDRDCCQTLRASTKTEVIERSIFDVPTDEMLEAVGVRKEELDVLIGGPPCQPFSKASYWSRGDSLRLKDPRAATLQGYLRVVEEALPRAFVLENVGGLAYSGKDEGLQFLKAELAEINRRTRSNYQPCIKVINAADYGVPQLRERILLVAARDGTRFEFPAATHAAPDSASKLEGYRTAWDAFGGLKVGREEDLAPRGKWAELLPSIPEGHNYLWHTDRGGGLRLFGWRRRYWTFLLKLAKALPSWTIQAQPGPSVGPFHWTSRRLSVRELCRLQTFPDHVRIVGGRTSAQKQVGNAVPSLLAEVLGRAIRTQLLGLSAERGSLKLLPKKRRTPPPPEQHADVPKQFLALEGRHAAHPGTGKGRGARARPKMS